MPEENLSTPGAAETTSTAPEASQTTTAAAQTQSVSTPAAETAATGTAPATDGGTGAGATPSQLSIRDWARQAGHDPGDAADDRAFLASLMQQAQAARQYQQAAQRYQQIEPHLPQFTQYLAQQQEEMRRRQQEEAQKNLWNPPEWDPTWQYQIKQGENGELVGDPAIVAKYRAALDFQRDTLQRFIQNPGEVVKPFVQQMLQEQQQQFQQMLSEREEQQRAQMVANQILRAPEEERRALFGIIGELDKLGVKETGATMALAQKLYKLQKLEAASAATSAQQADAAAKQKYLANGQTNHANRLANLGASATPAGRAAGGRKSNSLHELLTESFRAGGVTNETIARELQGGD